MIIVFVWFGGYLCVMSMNKISPLTFPVLIPQMRTVDWTNDTVAYAAIMWFGLIWCLIVIDYSKNFIVLYASSTYYFNSPKSELDAEGKQILDADGDPKPAEPREDGSADVMTGVKLAHFKHLGSICFGALIITIIKVIRFLFVYLSK